MIIPSWKRFKSWSMPTRFLYVVGIFTIIGVIFAIFNNNSPTINNDFSKTNNNENSSSTEISIVKSDNEGEIEKDNTNVYSISGVKNSKLENLIKKEVEINFDNNSNNLIKISHTGQLQLLFENTDSYIYTGGNIIILINNSICFEFESYKIPAMRVNPKSVINSELNKVISSYVEKNVNVFSKKIVQCLRG